MFLFVEGWYVCCYALVNPCFFWVVSFKKSILAVPNSETKAPKIAAISNIFGAFYFIAERACYYECKRRRTLWKRLNNRNVGAHCPTKMLQSRLLAENKIAEARIEPRAAQYHTSSGTLSVMRKYCVCMSFGVLPRLSDVFAMSDSPSWCRTNTKLHSKMRFP
jgi:hypothetical protein